MYFNISNDVMPNTIQENKFSKENRAHGQGIQLSDLTHCHNLEGLSLHYRMYVYTHTHTHTYMYILYILYIYIYSVQFSRSVVSDSLRPHESQHARPPCPSPNPRVHSDSHPSSRWCHPAISSSVVPFSSCSQSLPASESFPMSQLFAWGGQSTRASALASFLPKKSQGWSPSEWTG